MARHKTLLKENIEQILHERILLDRKKYMVMDVTHVNNGVYTLRLQPMKGEMIWRQVLVEDGRIVFVDT